MANPYSRIERLVRESLSEQLTGDKTYLNPAPLAVTKDGKKFDFDGVSPDKRIIVMIKATGHPIRGKPSILNRTKQGDLVRDTDVLMVAKRRYHAKRAILALSEERTYKWFMGKTRLRKERPVVFGQIAEEGKGVEIMHVPVRRRKSV
jgi:hypothetical protein